MPSKRLNKLRVAKTGRVEVVESVEDQPKEASAKLKTTTTAKKKSAKAKKKVVVEIESGSDDADEDEIDLKECEGKLKSIIKIFKLILLILVEKDYAMGTRVFGYRDLKNGKFLPRSNYSFTIDAFCDGKRHEYIYLYYEP